MAETSVWMKQTLLKKKVANFKTEVTQNSWLFNFLDNKQIFNKVLSHILQCNDNAVTK